MKAIPYLVLLFWALTFMPSQTIAQNDTSGFNPDIGTWKSYPYPLSHNAIKRVNESPDKWDVFVEDSIVKARRGLGLGMNTLADTVFFAIESYKDTLEGYSDDYFIFKVPDGYLIGFDKGRLGGALWWFSNDGNESYIIEHQRNVAIIGFEGEIYAFTGGFGKERSHIAQLRLNAKGRWHVWRTLKLPNPPVAYKIVGDKLYLATDDHLLLFTQQQGIKMLVRSPFVWGALFPSTLVVHGNDVYMGMNGGIIKITNVVGRFDNWELYWLKPR